MIDERKEPGQTQIYLDNAATSWPKPPEVAEAMMYYLEHVGANPGRAGHSLAVAAGRLVDAARAAVAELFHAPDPLRIVFTANVTESLNLALHGLLGPGDHVVTSSIEHNSMMRPLRALQQEGVEVSVVACAADGALDPSDVEAAIRPNTALIALNHASNVFGTILPIAEIGAIARRRGPLLLVDAATTGGALEIDVAQQQIDLLGFTGHKAMLGPTGTGGLVIGDRVDPARMKPLKRGGTGSRSDRQEQPTFLPDVYESGTLNVVGLAGLEAGVRWVLARGVGALRAEQMRLTRQLIEGLRDIPGAAVYGALDAERRVGPVSFNLRGVSPSDAGLRLDDEFGVLCRVGLHCAPAAHQTVGTFPNGSVRFCPGPFTTSEEIALALAAVRNLAGELR